MDGNRSIDDFDELAALGRVRDRLIEMRSASVEKRAELVTSALAELDALEREAKHANGG